MHSGGRNYTALRDGAIPPGTDADQEVYSSNDTQDNAPNDAPRSGDNEIINIDDLIEDQTSSDFIGENFHADPSENEPEIFELFEADIQNPSDHVQIPTGNIPLINIPIGDHLESPIGNEAGDPTGKYGGGINETGISTGISSGKTNAYYAGYLTKKQTGKSFWKPSGKHSGIISNPIPVATGSIAFNSIRSSNHFPDNKYPRDCYSFIATNGPDKNGVWTKSKAFFFFVGLTPFMFQISFLFSLVWSQVDEKRGTVGENDNPGIGFFAQFIPSGISNIVRWTQLLSLAAYVIFPDAGLKDVVAAVQHFPRSSKIQSGDQVMIMRLSCGLRFVQGVSAMFASLLLVITSARVVDIILNFTAVSFISNLDDYGFHLALTGELGPELQAEAKRLAITDLPPCMHRSTVPKYVYNRIVQLVVFMLLFGLAIVVIVAQSSSYYWTTKVLRVQFQEETGLVQYSGCFKYNEKVSFFQRHTYNSFDEGEGSFVRNTSIGYCREEREWILYQGNEEYFDPCDAKINELELARSAKTDTFDISTSFDETWVSSSNAPLELYFFELEDDTVDALHCSDTLGDGICDDVFNKLYYNYDGGDCCVATCTGSNCGRSDVADQSPVFNQSSISGIRFPGCIDPQMVPITITLNSMVSSRDPEFADVGDGFFINNRINENEWRSKAPVTPYFALDCDNKNVLTLYIDKSMEHSLETVMVKDGAECQLVVRNSTSNNKPDPKVDDPIWFINYTLFHVDEEDEKKVEILTQNSNEAGVESFRRIPICYFRKLEKYVDIENIYSLSDSSKKAISWLMDDDTGNSECEADEFIERYALINTYLAMGAENVISAERQCSWDSIICSEGLVGKVNTIKLQDLNLAKYIPSEIRLLPKLEELELSDNLFSTIPTEILKLSSLERLSMNYNDIALLPNELTKMTTLQVLDLFENKILSIPTEVGSMVNLQVLRLAGNCDSITNRCIRTVPTEIGLNTKLQELILDYNEIALLPTQIGNMSNMQLLTLEANKITSIPTEIGLMKNMEEFSIGLNFITSLPTQIGLLISLRNLDLDENSIASLPAEIKMMTSLERLNLESNLISSPPSELGSLSNLKILYLYNNGIRSIPSEFGVMSSLQVLDLQSNNISSIPKEIGQISSLQQLALSYNSVQAFPSEIGLWTSLEFLNLTTNEIRSIPSEFGLMSSLVFLDLRVNKISSIPTEIAKISSLQQLGLSYNFIRAVPSEIGLLTGLERLALNDNMIASLPTEIGHLASLTLLTLYKNNILSLPMELGRMTNLQNLHLHHNNINSLPTEMGLMTSLQVLHLYDNNIPLVPTEIGFLTGLKDLRFQINKISSLPSEIGMMTSLQNIIGEKNRLYSLPPEIGKLTSLQNIFFSGNRISTLPTSIGRLTKTQKLRFYNNTILSLPSEIGLMTSLQELDLGSNNFSFVPSQIGQLSSLQDLYLESNLISSPPREVGFLSNLRGLHLQLNEISSIPSEFGMRMSSLQKLDLRFNKILSFPTDIGQITSLQELGLLNNLISAVPSEIGLLTGLKLLLLSDNIITSTISSEIGLLTNLQFLWLYDNLITSLPTEIGLLTGLKELQLHDNSIASLPTEIGLLTSLTYLSLYGNNITSDNSPQELGKICLNLDMECDLG